MRTGTFFLILTLVSLAVSPAWGARMDSETQTHVIERLDRILSKMDRKDSSYLPSNLRLADLLSERARLRFMNEIEEGCDGCKGSKADRKRALGLYEELFPKAQEESKGTILFQMAHLYEMAGDQKKAISLHQSILKNPKKKHSRELLTRSRIALADLYYQTAKFKEALSEYQIAFRDPKASNRGLILYRIGWCQFNLDRLNQGIRTLEKLASTPALLTKESPQGTAHDPAFQGDVLRDLATFYSRRKVGSGEISKFLKLAPQDQKKDLILFFAGETDRIGQKQAASDLYRLYLGIPDLTREERLEAQLSLAQVNYDKGQASKSTEDFEIAAREFKNTNCSADAKCQEFQKKMRRYVTELHRSKKIDPDRDVLKAYAIYAKTFPQDTQMAILGAQVAVDIKQAGMAALLYHHASRSAEDPKLRETALLGQIEAAEKSGDPKLREEAYLHYLELNPKGPKAFEVRYQLAHLSYERKEWAKAAGQFRELALDKGGDAGLRKKSADLALDSLAAQKRDADIEKWSLEFAAVFPQAKDEFHQISRKAVQNQAAQAANSKDSSTSELRGALKKMQSASLAGATDREKLVHFRNQALLAEKVGDETALIASLGGLLAVRSLSPGEKEETLARKVGAYERLLDFKSAYRTALRMKFPRLSGAERELRLGTLADLAGLKPQKHYEAALRSGLKGPRSASVRSRLVLLSTRPVRELARHKNELARSPAILSETVLLVFGRTGNLRELESYGRMPALRGAPAGRYLRKQPFYGRHQALDRRMQKHSLNAKSDARLQATLRERIRLLGEADESLAQAVQLQDYTAQIMALTTVVRENERMVRDLAALPLPKGLKPAEQERYLELLKNQSRPYLTKSKFAAQKLDAFWESDATLNQIIEDYRRGRVEIRRILAPELRILAAISPSYSIRSRLNSALGESAPSREDLLSAREDVREKPEDKRRLEKLKSLETKIGHPLMSSYLDARLGQMERGSM